MLKIDESIRRKYIPEHVWTQLAPFDRDEVRTLTIFLVFFLTDILCIIPIIADPFVKGYFIAVIIPVAFINLWALIILARNYYSTQMEVLYFFAAVGIVCAYSMLMTALKIAYFNAKVTSSAFAIASILFVIGWVIYFGQYIFRKYADMKWKYGKKNYLLDFLGLILAFLPSNGYNLYHFYIKGHPFEFHLTSMIFLAMAILPIYLSVLYFDKILFIHANRNHFRLQQPSRKEIKQAEAKGKKIIVQ